MKFGLWSVLCVNQKHLDTVITPNAIWELWNNMDIATDVDILLSKHTLLFMKRSMILKRDSKMYQEDTIQRMLKDTNELEGN